MRISAITPTLPAVAVLNLMPWLFILLVFAFNTLGRDRKLAKVRAGPCAQLSGERTAEADRLVALQNVFTVFLDLLQTTLNRTASLSEKYTINMGERGQIRSIDIKML